MITENDKMRPQDESQKVETSWYVAPKPPVPKGWLVFSEEFVLRVLQGSYSRHRPSPANVCLAGLGADRAGHDGRGTSLLDFDE